MNIEEYKQKLQDLFEKNIPTDPSLGLLSRPGDYTKDVNKKTIGETAYQRALILAERSSLAGVGTTNWLDIELPVVFRASSRRLSLDLIGRAQNGPLVLCELKYDKKEINPNSERKPETDSPVHALLELLYYHILIMENAEKLQNCAIRHGNKLGDWDWCDCKKPDGVVLAIAANATYWTRWEKYHKWQEIVAKVASIKSELSPLSPVTFYRTLNPDLPFSEQAKGATITPYGKKGKSKETYRPTLGKSAEATWEEVSDLK
jgi:hypothetical protein